MLFRLNQRKFVKRRRVVRIRTNQNDSFSCECSKGVACNIAVYICRILMMEQSSEFAFMALKGSGSVYGNIGGGN